MRFFDTDRWNEIWQTISRNRKRSIMTALGVFWGIFMLIVLLGAGMGLGRLFRAQLGGMSTNTVLLQSSRTSVPYKGMPTGRWWRMDNDDLEAVSKLEEVEYTSGVIWGNELHCSYKERKGDYQMMGYTPDYQKINPQKIIAGRYINEVDMVHKRKVCVIGTQVQKDLFPGEPDPTGKVIKVGGSYFTIIGSASCAANRRPCRSATSNARLSSRSRWRSRCSATAARYTCWRWPATRTFRANRSRKRPAKPSSPGT